MTILYYFLTGYDESPLLHFIPDENVNKKGEEE
jgi:hypothetical protein